MQNRRGLQSSSLKRSNTTPNFRSKASQVLDEGEDEGDGEEEDEETLQLRLAEIQARLKLKQLQKNRGRSGSANSNTEEADYRRSRLTSAISSSSRTQKHAPVPQSPQSTQKAPTEEVQIPMSPPRREVPDAEHWSPRRYQMGIDKGWKASDVSLKRPPRPTSQLGMRSGAMSRSSDVSSSRPQTSPGGGGLHRIKSFSERMAEGRAAEKSRLERAERVHANRSSGFQLDKAEVEALKTAAENQRPSPPSTGPRQPEVQHFSREDIMRSLGKPRSEGIPRSQTTPNVRKIEDSTSKQANVRHHFIQAGRDSPYKDLNRDEPQSREDGLVVNPPDSSKFESYSSLHLTNRILPHSFLARNLANKKVLRIPDLLKTVKAPSFELPEEIDGDYVVFGIIASKSDPRQKKNPENSTAKEVDPYDEGRSNTNSYMVMTLTDLKWTIDLFLFETAYTRYYKMSEGTLIAILNPTIMPPPKHKLDTNRFSLSLSSSDDKVLEIGYARDIGFCKAVRKDGKTCQSWVDGRKTEFCDFHVDIQVRRTQGQRMGVNSNTGMFGPGGNSGSRTGVFDGGRGRGRGAGAKQGLKSEGAQYDWSSQSLYYVAPSAKNMGNGRTSYHPAATRGSAASLIDAHDDPFLAAGMNGRGQESKEERLRRRLATQQREIDITRKLVTGKVSGPGADYLRARTGNETPSKADAPSTPSAVPSSHGLNLSAKADNVRLSPMKRAHDKPHGSGVKKTRFITSKGIREAGRESLGAGAETATGGRRIMSDDDDDDELDII
ncbi:hypothetical protein N7532_004603 [Penicillium argentinense]|uniref:Zinc finger Mcm10/DnaG-type domain-containing protein n=1 Tax=Penicillium argentinense TaxID=1131581 RepID=A0A9W9FPS9_9EURO|nr:uncharacterized protein N7532_004603 [Penicillium argentinense]KAJ5104074.1 hypothetical protein N7532_004603 [Penicillium argentinense]